MNEKVDFDLLTMTAIDPVNHENIYPAFFSLWQWLVEMDQGWQRV